MLKANIAVLVSGGGTNLQALINAEKSGIINSGSIKLVVANNANAYALERAKNAGINTAVVLKSQCGSQEAFEKELIRVLAHNYVGDGFLVVGAHAGIVGHVVGIVCVQDIERLRVVKLPQAIESGAHFHFAHQVCAVRQQGAFHAFLVVGVAQMFLIESVWLDKARIGEVYCDME